MLWRGSAISGTAARVSIRSEQAGGYARGVELLQATGDPHVFAEAVSLIEEAAGSGEAEALATLAAIEATGAGRPQDWAKALDHLALAAERGSEDARAQLRLLTGSADGEDWPALRSSIDPAKLLQVPEREILAEQPRLRAIRGFASRAECEWIIAKARPKLGPAMIWDAESGTGKLDPNRNNSALELRLTDMDVVTAMVRARISTATRLPEPVFETSQVLHYSVGQEFRPHFDFLDSRKPGTAADIARRGQRIATFLIWLNDGFEGGETQFPDAGISFTGRTGDALFWANVLPNGQPDPLTLHAGRAPSRGEKWIFSQWIRDRSPGAPAN